MLKVCTQGLSSHLRVEGAQNPQMLKKKTPDCINVDVLGQFPYLMVFFQAEILALLIKATCPLLEIQFSLSVFCNKGLVKFHTKFVTFCSTWFLILHYITLLFLKKIFFL